MVKPLLPGVSGSASSTVTSSTPVKLAAGWVSNVAMPTVPGTDCSTNANHALELTSDSALPWPTLRFSWPGGTGVMPPLPAASERMLHASIGSAWFSIVWLASAALPPVMRSEP